jgi:hypothetical protein
MKRAPTVVVATTASAVAAVVALVVLVMATLLSSSDLARVGLGLLFAVPVVRNTIVVWRGQGLERGLAVLGIVLVVVVAAVAFSAAGAAA